MIRSPNLIGDDSGSCRGGNRIRRKWAVRLVRCWSAAGTGGSLNTMSAVVGSSAGVGVSFAGTPSLWLIMIFG
jgi:hypothetical protein